MSEEVISVDQAQQLEDAEAKSNKKITMIVYALQAAGVLLLVPIIAAVIVNYMRKDDVQGTWLESHFRWQIRTFWFYLLWTVIGFATLFIVVGMVVLVAASVWYIYRIAKGWMRFSDGKEMYA
ncbi:hypothetical protein [Mariprofundus sp. KV]|uniref:DUF4870 family protein n=1 Tax=Mariprofundus sp. KV TaxID=2608715 RepID=UPI0015A09B1F|nr:hypothetical protein [Mariprofundus sp. KV]NWF36186.1 hypothetical protein [Mariprofundus sp. KV]